MSYHSKQNYIADDAGNKIHHVQHFARRAFTLTEVAGAVIILGLACSSILVVIDRCVASAADSALRMHAFETARENMEKLLVSRSVKETVEYGISDNYPEIAWQTVVETFYEPITDQMWVQAVCSSEYEDSQGEKQTVELTHWLTNVSKAQLLQIMQEQEKQQQQWLDEQIIKTIEDAAEYAGVDGKTIEQWLENGMLTLDDGSFVRMNLDLYKRTEGKPAEQEQQLQVGSMEDLIKLFSQRATEGGQKTSDLQDVQNKIDPTTGLTYQEIEQMDTSQIFELLKQKKAKKP